MLVARGLTKEYLSGTQPLTVLRDVTFDVPAGAFVSIEKRVVFDDAARVGGCHLKNTWLAVGEEVLGSVERGIEQ